ncbi:hypothetical protein U14_02113 [Candidatus Moduliflexus flocculans]|uniref:DUF2271 domain-containing protein n=1 Tax=Candidatus Moduliflexus flocculans TaxID=1499966 RepID=A0A0S6VTK4_9BACT|nr:hypothetical protein U14_02113 [Candidatus Moduliflexus flocculans]
MKMNMLFLGVILAILPQLAAAEELTTLTDATGKSLTIEATAGEYWGNSFKVALVKTIKTTPQIAIWLEDPDGKYLDTLYVTEKFAKQAWTRKQDITYRPESLPYWMHKRATAGQQPPTRTAPLSDAVTGASPKTGLILHTKAVTDLTNVVVLMELNSSYDENDAFPNDAKKSAANYNGVSGQPAVVYAAKVNLSQPGQYPFELIGHSSPSGADGQLFSDTSTLTTALKIINKAIVTVQ